MARIRHLSKAPIREAVLDIRIPEAEALAPEKLQEALASTAPFAELHEMRRGAVHVQISAGSAESRMEGGDVFGFRGFTEDRLYVVQFRTDGFTCSRLPPYPDWSEFANNARRYAESFMRAVNPRYVERLALRYINHFRLPHPSELGDYFVGLPAIPPALPQFLSNLLTRFTIHDPTNDFSAHVTLGLLDDLDPERIGVILDIDAFQTTDFKPDVQLFWETFERLRVFKNIIFFEFITERNAEMHE
jgi:uncharacterized protein (TIGR04255 family)